METGRPSRPTLSTIAELALVLRQDALTDVSTRRRRDRKIGQELNHLRDVPHQQLTQWLHHADAPGSDRTARSVAGLHRLACILLAAIGLLAGWGAALAVFRYDGTDPVNVIHVLAVFVLAQLLLTGVTVLTMLPGGMLRWVPGAGALQDLLALISPGRIHQALMRRLPATWRESIDVALGTGKAHRLTFGRVEKWAISHAAQWGALCFQLAAIAGALYLVVFSDLAFSWNTTLEVDAADLHRLTSGLAAPWSAIATKAAPSLELIEATRHFRLNDGSFPGLSVSDVSHPSALGGWWPFLVAAMAAYGVLPRLLTLFVATNRFQAAIRDALLYLPGAQDVLDRLNGQLVETAADQPEIRTTDAQPPASTAVLGPPAWPVGTRVQLVNWAQVELTEEATRPWCEARLSALPTTLHRAGGAQTMEQDQDTLASIASSDTHEPVVILVRAWEPPVAEFLDFIRDLRACVARARRIVIVPVGVSADHGPAGPDAEDVRRWHRRLITLGDSGLVLHTPRPNDGEGAPR